MNAVTAALWPDYVRTNCTTCKPGPDGTWTGAGWTLIGVGAAVLLLGICMLWFSSRSGTEAEADPEPEPEPEVTEPPAVMDQAQREDLERRAAEAEQDPQTTNSQHTAAGSVVVLGVGAGVLGLFILGFSASRVQDDKSQLRLAATSVLSAAIDGPAVCRESAAVEAQVWPTSVASSQFLPSAANCDASPREYAQQREAESPAGVFIPVEYVFSSSFTTDGQVTVHDKQDNRSLCVTVPDTDVAAAAATATATQASDAPSTLPLYDDVSVDPSPYIRDGACPDAPVSSPNTQ